ncbi:wax ester/triacylglycerol synthase family O-acyltransferase [Allobranchiibius sp. GilTou73]|uniref:WS/DGAT/MGAT family O-acyltransferase n=1 Tax=Allobranchiibius sp. GilTou73 TaxID=2904523 RepID=UPI001F1D22C7|nr:wax ester/triacylglycerol synthase family O-acyltransferase [Allobranchiibius sp. GilTou73]UIJ34048.1 wax ester/triacylglycerol synthase family O-acyltransferase [Allobranchiibius sp. GilTou73]
MTPSLIDPTSLAFLLSESRAMPMHVGSLQLFEKPPGAPRDYARRVYEQLIAVEDINPLFLKRPTRSWRTAGQWMWEPDAQFDVEHHVRHSALPKPGRVRELLELCSRLHGTPLARDRPLWEAHVIEGLRDGRFAIYVKLHHSLVDGIAASRLLMNTLSTDPNDPEIVPMWAARPRRERPAKQEESGDVATQLLRTVRGLAGDAAGMPGALARTLTRGARDETSPVSMRAPKTIFNTTITGSRRFAAQSWPLERLVAISKASGTTVNDVVLAMCGGAVRGYLEDLGELPDTSLVAMVPVGLNAKNSQSASSEGGNAIGTMMARLATDVAEPAQRLAQIHAGMQDGKQALSQMTANQIVAMSAVGMTPAMLLPWFGLQGVVRPPFNLIISNVPGARETHYLGGAKLVGSYPLSIPMQGMALNITCASYAGSMEFGLTGCRRTVPHLQWLLRHLDDELGNLERAAGIS